MPPEAVPDWLFGAWAKIRCCLNWCFSAGGPGDSAYLGAMFALNASFAYVDSFTRSFMESMRDDFNRLVAKYRKPEWIDSVARGDTAEALGKKERLSEIANKALEIENEIPKLFTANARIWKRLMVVSAVILLVCMAIPYYGRFLVLFAFPVPMFLRKCLKERDSFNNKAQEACRKIDESYEQIKGANEDALNAERVALADRLDRIEEKLNGFMTQWKEQHRDAKAAKKR